MMSLSLQVTIEHWPILGQFTIARGSKVEAILLLVTVSDGQLEGRGECVPYAHYGETIEGVRDAILAMEDLLKVGISRDELLHLMPAGAARNGLDCALWDYQAKRGLQSAIEIAGLDEVKPLNTAYTISLCTPDHLFQKVQKVAHYPLLKLKLGGEGDHERLKAAREAAPRSRLIVDANESWQKDDLEEFLQAAANVGVELIEQPLPAGQDEVLADMSPSVLLCADESVHDRFDLPHIAERYQAVNIKLDKAGGLTEALAMASEARELGLKIMIGCMVSTSLSMAPAFLLAQQADWVDLDGPLLLAIDRDPGLTFDGTTIMPIDRALWG